MYVLVWVIVSRVMCCETGLQVLVWVSVGGVMWWETGM